VSRLLQEARHLGVDLLGVALLEAFQRDHAVAVAVLVPGLVRGLDLGLPLLGGGFGRRRRWRRFGGLAAGSEAARVQLAKSPSSSRGMKRV
jgi:hypothetical protein